MAAHGLAVCMPLPRENDDEEDEKTSGFCNFMLRQKLARCILKKYLSDRQVPWRQKRRLGMAVAGISPTASQQIENVLVCLLCTRMALAPALLISVKISCQIQRVLVQLNSYSKKHDFDLNSSFNGSDFSDELTRPVRSSQIITSHEPQNNLLCVLTVLCENVYMCVCVSVCVTLCV